MEYDLFSQAWKSWKSDFLRRVIEKSGNCAGKKKEKHIQCMLVCFSQDCYIQMICLIAIW